jgi:hypothetical protein
MKLESKLSSILAILSFAFVASATSACSSDNAGSPPPPSYGCTAKGPCANDPTPSTDQASSCQTLQDDTACGAAFTAYSACAYAAAECTDGGMSDPTLDSTASGCNSAYATYTTCLQNKMNDGGV